MALFDKFGPLGPPALADWLVTGLTAISLLLDYLLLAWVRKRARRMLKELNYREDAHNAKT